MSEFSDIERVLLSTCATGGRSMSALRSTVILSSDSYLIEKGHCEAKSNVKL